MNTSNTSITNSDFQDYCAFQAKVAEIMEPGVEKEREGLIVLENTINQLIEKYEKTHRVEIRFHIAFETPNKLRLSGGVEREWKKAKAYGECLQKPNP